MHSSATARDFSQRMQTLMLARDGEVSESDMEESLHDSAQKFLGSDADTFVKFSFMSVRLLQRAQLCCLCTRVVVVMSAKHRADRLPLHMRNDVGTGGEEGAAMGNAG